MWAKPSTQRRTNELELTHPYLLTLPSALGLSTTTTYERIEMLRFSSLSLFPFESSEWFFAFYCLVKALCILSRLVLAWRTRNIHSMDDRIYYRKTVVVSGPSRKAKSVTTETDAFFLIFQWHSSMWKAKRNENWINGAGEQETKNTKRRKEFIIIHQKRWERNQNGYLPRKTFSFLSHFNNVVSLS